MNTHETEVASALKDSLEDVTMHTPVNEIVGAGRARRRRRHLTFAATGVVAVTGVALGVPALSHPSTAPPGPGVSAGGVHIRTAAFSLDTQADGTLRVTWDKEKYFADHAGLQRALRAAGFPVLVKDGVFCRGPQDDGYLSPSGSGHGVERVVHGERQGDGRVNLVFDPAAMPRGKQLFIGYLSPAQLAAVNGNPGSVERLVPVSGALTCDTQAPPPHIRGEGKGD
ncbi:hypothetical protein [Actinomadura sp. DC4]|uniref:hypothetical protein n=1 Tax=Actinomadura sp. DC4 TaxID=3055069 RepID=UPI0025B24AC6|nr:hypothetical protein [Actinomadura sp. DC4]MDN3357817.1 hypothetical protein [Actinomadura sp. DC4]